MSEQPAWKTTAALLIPHPGAARVLLLRAGPIGHLPTFDSPELRWMAEIDYLRPLIQASLGFDPVVLRTAWVNMDRTLKLVDVLYELEPPPPGWEPPANGVWVDQPELASSPLDHSDYQAAVLAHLAEAAGAPIPPLRPPWARRGWVKRASDWICAQMDERGTPVSGPVEQVKTWGISSILRAPTSAGAVYLKASSRLALFAQEARVVAALATRYPPNIPAPLAVEPAEGWLLLADFGAELRGTLDREIWHRTIVSYGTIQRDAERDLGWLFAAGCLDRRLEGLVGQLDAVLDDVPALHLLEPAERERVIAERSRFAAICDQLAAIGIPATLVHGDCHSGNIALNNGTPLFFDWTDACVSHPFSDALLMLGDESLAAEQRTSLRDEYLGLWADIAPLEQLQVAWALAEVVGALHQVVSYYHITRSLEPGSRGELEWGIHSFLRGALAALDKLDLAPNPRS